MGKALTTFHNITTYWKRIPLEIQLYLVACLIGEVLGVMTAIENIAVNWFVQIVSVAGAVAYAVFLVIFVVNKKVLKVGVCLLTTLLLAVMLLFNDGFNGGAQYFIILTFVAALVLLKGLKRIFVMAFDSFVFAGLIVLQFLSPDLFLKYTDRTSRFFDLMVSFSMSIIVILAGLQAVFRIITLARLDTEKKHEELNQTRERLWSLGLLTAQVGHELNTPNHVIALNASLLDSFHRKVRETLIRAQEDGQIESPLLEFDFKLSETEGLIKAITKASGQINQIVANLRFEVLPQNSPVPLDLAQVVHSTSKLYEVRWREDTDHLVVQTPFVPVYISGVEFRLQQLIVNLVSNALHALPDRSKSVTLKVAFDKNEAILSVNDEGEGMSSEVQDKLGTPLFTTRQAQQGTGFGWSLCQEIVKEHHARLEFESYLGVGTSVRIYFPCSSTAYSVPAE